MRKSFSCWMVLLMAAGGALGAGPGDTVVVVYNKNLPASKKLAEYYAERRSVPRGQLFGVDVNAGTELISRQEFNDKLQKPLFDWLVSKKLFTLNPQKRSAKTDLPHRSVTQAKIRYVILCYGIPLKIARDGGHRDDADQAQEALRGRNEAAVDSELALLPSSREAFPLTGPLRNPFYLGTNTAALSPTNGIVLVTRLDGPTPEIAQGLIDKALYAEANGLWGRAYVDGRGITNGEYKLGDDWMRMAANITRRLGFETVLDEKDATFGAEFPMSQIAFYAGWYDPTVSGPFTRPAVEFMPGAFAYHLQSYSAATVRSASNHWVGPLLAKGATISFGSVDEPYLAGTPNVAVFLDRLVYRRFTFAEAAYACQASLSWQTTVVGDPLYCPFAQPPDVLHGKLERENSPLLSWSHLRVIGLNQATGLPVAELLKYLAEIPTTKTSAVLLEKVGDLHRSEKRLPDAAEAYSAAIKSNPSPQQKIRLLLAIGELQTLLGRDQDAFDAYKQLVMDAPDYPSASMVHQQLDGLARKLGKSDEAEKLGKQTDQSGK